MDKNGPDQQAIFHLTHLGMITDQIKALQAARERAVGYCRDHGASWAMIGVALDTSTQAAWDKFSGHQRDSEIPQGSLFD